MDVKMMKDLISGQPDGAKFEVYKHDGTWSELLLPSIRITGGIVDPYAVNFRWVLVWVIGALCVGFLLGWKINA